MLENSLWQKYNPIKTIKETLIVIYGCEVSEITDDERALYASLKRHFTKKEFKLFMMAEGGVSDEEIMGELGLLRENYEKFKYKTYRKLHQDKIKNEIRIDNSIDDEEIL